MDRLTKRSNFFSHGTGENVPEIPVIAVDGIFGRLTKGAVIAFQQYLGIEETGAIGPVEWAEIITLGNNL